MPADPGDTTGLPDDLRVCWCARCGALLRCNVVKGFEFVPTVQGRAFGRPYCALCYDRAKDAPLPSEAGLRIVQTWE